MERATVHRAEQVRPQVGDRAHQQSTGAAAFNRHALRIAISIRRKVLDDRDEVRKGVHLLHQPSRIVPWLAHVSAAADMCVRDHDTAIKQAQSVSAEPYRQ